MITRAMDGSSAAWSAAAFVGAFVLLACGVHAAPLGVSLCAVLLFAGPHNWLEARYFLGRMPGRFGPLAGFSLAAAGGVAVLTLAFIAYAVAVRYEWCGEQAAITLLAGWNSTLILWVAGLADWRRRLPPKRDWPWLWPGAFVLLSATWFAPYWINVALVYLHPLVALVFLDRELRRSRSVWRVPYRWALMAVPVCLAGLAWWGGRAEPLPGDDMLAARLQSHAGAEVWTWIPPRVLVAWHAYLELLHYGVWVVALPALAIGVRPWRMATVPFARRSERRQRGLATLVVAGIGVMVALWAGFAIDYTTTRDIYFTVAVFHVLAEFPMLLRFV
jgi:hypothetical protein